MDAALSEYAFDRDFFHADTSLFAEIFGGVCKYVMDGGARET